MRSKTIGTSPEIPYPQRPDCPRRLREITLPGAPETVDARWGKWAVLHFDPAEHATTRPAGESRRDSVVVLVETDAVGAEFDCVAADYVEQRPMKLGATKAERRRAELPSDGTGGVVDDQTPSEIAEFHPFDRRRDALDALERPDVCEDPRPVRPKAQAVSHLEVADRARVAIRDPAVLSVKQL